jgi:hypothetical protein
MSDVSERGRIDAHRYDGPSKTSPLTPADFRSRSGRTVVVDVGDCQARVAEAVTHGRQRDSRAAEHRGTEVTQIMQAKVRFFVYALSI